MHFLDLPVSVRHGRRRQVAGDLPTIEEILRITLIGTSGRDRRLSGDCRKRAGRAQGRNLSISLPGKRSRKDDALNAKFPRIAQMISRSSGLPSVPGENHTSSAAIMRPPGEFE